MSMKDDEKFKNCDPYELIELSVVAHIHLLQNIIIRTANKWLAKNNLDIKYEQIPVLMIVRKNGTSNQQTIADLLNRDKSSVYRSVLSLEAKGLIETKVDLENKRNKLINLTNEGKEFAEQLEKIVFLLEEKFKENLTDEQYDDIINNFNNCKKIIYQLYEEL